MAESFGETNLKQPKNLELLIEASCSLVHQFAAKSGLHEFLQQKCFFADIHVKRHILPDARPEQHQESTRGGAIWESDCVFFLPKTS